MVLMVAGARFSGQAALTGVLSEMGAIIVPGRNGPSGAEGAAAINDRVLAAIDANWAGVPAGSHDALVRLADGPIGEAASEMIDQLRDLSPVVLCDPCNSLTLPFWRAVLDDELVMLHCIRAPHRAVRPIVERKLLPAAAGFAVWEHYTRACVESARGLDGVVVDFDRGRAAPDATVEVLRRLIGMAHTPPATAGQSLGSAEDDERAGAADLRAPASALELWSRLERVHGETGRDLEPTDPDGDHHGIIETAIYAVRRAATADAYAECHDSLERAQADVAQLKRQLRGALEGAAFRERDSDVASARIAALEARNRQLESARSLRLARAIGDPARRLLGKLR